MAITSPALSRRAGKRAAYAVAIVGFQTVAAFYFLIDGIEDILTGLRTGLGIGTVMECVVALGLIFGVALGGRYAHTLLAEARKRETVLRAARGEMSSLIEQRFREWGLSPSEGEVALFALKGSSIAEIAEMRTAAEGTVRSQLSQIYAKAGVKNQSGLMALFIDELIDPLVR